MSEKIMAYWIIATLLGVTGLFYYLIRKFFVKIGWIGATDEM